MSKCFPSSFLLLIIILLFNCKSRAINDTGLSVNNLKTLVLKNGDTNAYYSLSIEFLELPHGNFLPFAKHMADTYNYPQAFYDVYNQSLKPTDDSSTTLSLDSCDNTTRNFAIGYLIKAFKKGHYQSIEELSDLYREGKFVRLDTNLSNLIKNNPDSAALLF